MGIEIDEREALSCGSSFLKIFYLGEEGDLNKKKKKMEENKETPLPDLFLSSPFPFSLPWMFVYYKEKVNQ